MDQVFPLGCGPCEWKKQGCIDFSKDQENEDSKIFSLSLASNRGVRFQFKQTFECSGPYSETQPAKLTSHSTCGN